MFRATMIVSPLLLLLPALTTVRAPLAAAHPAAQAAATAYEVWVIDQSDTTPDGGGTLYIYPGDALAGTNPAGATPEVIDLGGEAGSLCLDHTGTFPKRPHMLMFNHSQTHAILSFVATGHVLFLDAATRKPLACLDAGEQAHAAHPAHDESYAVVANQNGKLLQRISTDYGANAFTLIEEATLNLATCTTPSGAACEDPVLRPDNAPICPIVESGNRLTFVTLRGGGLFVVDTTATPMTIVAEYDAATVGPNGCGGIETAGKMYINAGGGTKANPLTAKLYAFPLNKLGAEPAMPNTPAPSLIFDHQDRGAVDSHGAVLAGDGNHLWIGDRAANRIVIVSTVEDATVGEIELSGSISSDPAPDLLDRSPDGSLVFASLRGPNPLTANVPDVNNAVGGTAGLGILRVDDGGRSGELIAVIPITHMVEGTEAADPHAIAVRRTA